MHFGEPLPDDRFIAAIRRAFEKGVRTFITADVYGNGQADEMLGRARPTRFAGQEVRVAAPEDVIVIKALAHDEPSFRHWHDSLAIIAAQELDWGYLVRRARHGAHRVLSLLVYAQSNDLIVPDYVIRQLHETIYQDASLAAG